MCFSPLVQTDDMKVTDLNCQDLDQSSCKTGLVVDIEVRTTERDMDVCVKLEVGNVVVMCITQNKTTMTELVHGSYFSHMKYCCDRMQVQPNNAI